MFVFRTRVTILGVRPNVANPLTEKGEEEGERGMTATTQRRPVEDAEPQELAGIPGFRSMADVTPEQINWVWFPYIPAGKLTMLEGDPGLGKSSISIDIAARISTGEPLPGQEHSREPGKVMILSAEDGLGETLQPRLVNQRANLENVWASDAHFTLTPEGLRKVEAGITTTKAAIVFLDPIVAYMGSNIDMNKANEVRGLMAALAQTAKRTGSAIVAVRHLRKGGSQNAIYRGLGSIDFTAAARSALQVGVSKSGTHFMEHIKHNLSAQGLTLAYEVDPDTGTLSWMGGMDWSLEPETRRVSTRARISTEAFLFELLRDGPKPAGDVLRGARSAGISETRLNKEKLGLAHSRKIGSIWFWELDQREGMGDMPSPEPIIVHGLT